MINKTLSQKGSTHVVIIVILVVALLGVLGFVFWQNFMQANTHNGNDNDATVDTQEDNNAIAPEESPVIVNNDSYSLTIPDGFSELTEQLFTYTGSLKAVNTFQNEQGDYFEVLTPVGDGGGISSDYSWTYGVENGKLSITKSERCIEGVGCTAGNGSVEGIISDQSGEYEYYFAFGNKSSDNIDLAFVDEFVSTFQFK
jgi:hypothetical protein